MKVGDLVKGVQSSSDKLASPFVGEAGIIVAAHLGKFTNQDSFSVLLRDRLLVFGASYLEVLNESR